MVAASISDIGLVETAIAVRAGDPPSPPSRMPMCCASLAGGGRDLRSRYQGVDGRNSRCKGSAATRHRQRGGRPAQNFPERRHRDARNWPSPTRVDPIGCTQSTEIITTEGVTLSGSLPPGCDLATTYTAGVTVAAAHPQQAQDLIALLTGAGQQEQRQRAGFISSRG